MKIYRIIILCKMRSYSSIVRTFGTIFLGEDGMHLGTRIYELIRRYGFYIGVLPSLIAFVLPENYFYISIPILLFAILLDSLSFYYGRIPEGLRKSAGRLQRQPCMAFARLLRCLRRAFWRHSFCVRRLSGGKAGFSSGYP